MAKQRRYLHLDTERTDYSVSDQELTNLDSASRNIWKDFFIACLCLGIPKAINGFSSIDFTKFSLTAGIFLSCLFGTKGLLAAIILGIAWYKTSSKFKNVINKIKSKPRVDISELDLVSLVEDVGKIDD